MKGITLLIIFGVLLGSPAAATPPDTWNEWTLIGEGLAGAFLGAGLTVAAAQSEEYEDRLDWPAVAGWSAGNAGGVILVGEFFDGRSANWSVTNPVTFVAASAIPVTAGVIAEHKNLDNDEELIAALFIFFGTPVVTTITYNLVKNPVDETSEGRAAVGLQPYAGLLPDTGAGYVPVYGITASF